MKPLINVFQILKSPSLIIKISSLLFLSLLFFFLGSHFSLSFPQLTFFTSTTNPSQSPSISLSSNLNKSFDVSSLMISPPLIDPPTHPALRVTPPPSPVLFLPPPPSPPPEMEKFGVLDENGTMRDDFGIGEFDPEIVENWGNGSESGTDEVRSGGIRVRVRKYRLCGENMREYIPCMDNEDAIRRMRLTEKGKRWERHCPEKGRELDCLVPAPRKYKNPIPWPRSRDEVWYDNVPHTRLVDDKGGQNWITKDKNKFKFPGGGTQFIHGADQYLNQISEMIPAIAFGRHTRVVLDIGCGVASFGAYLFSRNVITLSIAPKDVHENQIQFALERGVPAMVAAFATRRLPFPSQAFDLIHCSRCRVNWTRDDGVLLLEVNRLLRAGGYFAWAAQPVYKHEEVLEEQWSEMVNLTSRLCWELVSKKGYIAIWQKPLNNGCYLNRGAGIQPPLCDLDDDPDQAWYTTDLSSPLVKDLSFPPDTAYLDQ